MTTISPDETTATAASREEFASPAAPALEPIWAAQNDLATILAELDEWNRAAGLCDRAPHVGAWSYWWHLRAQLAHNCLTPTLPFVRALATSAAASGAPRVIAIGRDFDAHWPCVLRALFPAAELRPLRTAWRAHFARARDFVVRWRRARATRTRLARLLATRSQRPCALVVSRDRCWNGERDTELGAVIESLAQAGLDPIVLATAVGRTERARAFATRPVDHLFEDWLYFEDRRIERWRPADGSWVPRGAPPRLGLDFGTLAAEVERGPCANAFLQRLVAARAIAPLVAHLRPRVAILTDENGGQQGFKLGLEAAGVPVVALQHGVIHGQHASYIYPADAPTESIALCAKTCVFGAHEAELLTRASCYGADRVVITGQPGQEDARSPRSAWGTRAAAGEALRARVLPRSCQRLLFFTSQAVYRTFTAPKLLALLAASSRRYFLVVRPHPAEPHDDFWRAAIADRYLSARVLVTRDESLRDWLDACDVHLSATSTVLSEAALAGRPSLTLGTAQFGDVLGCVAAGVARTIESFPNLEAAVESWCRESASDPRVFEQRRAEYVDHHFAAGGRDAADRVAEVAATVAMRQRTL